MEKSNYYKEQLNNIEINSFYYPARIKVKSLSNETKWMDINKESAQELIEWLNTNFINK